MDDIIDTNEARKLVDVCLERGSNLILILLAVGVVDKKLETTMLSAQ